MQFPIWVSLFTLFTLALAEEDPTKKPPPPYYCKQNSYHRFAVCIGKENHKNSNFAPQYITNPQNVNLWQRCALDYQSYCCMGAINGWINKGVWIPVEHIQDNCKPSVDWP
ncbi:hypothetical protein Pst134EA_002463 [Puccinia striiformis f. sp. tritici]|uniref:hypothetical protein n=1 Tax=Puccinia striiformis f. sp. tritici TaxID=168172 RepID=UPI0020078F5D|nr:hypothetical protein Pst134EA_002463 [Puccinia striiformis f. sp. tritici]KAH9471828.1 hypothetical protein Pst134EA_002463 [Puccinia striiformis f. sp. tritici]